MVIFMRKQYEYFCPNEIKIDKGLDFQNLALEWYFNQITLLLESSFTAVVYQYLMAI